MEASTAAVTGARPAPPELTHAAESDIRALSLSVAPAQTDDPNLFVVTVWGWQAPTCQPVEGKPTIAMTEVTAPVWPDTPGQWENQVGFSAIGPHKITVWNDDGSLTSNVFSGPVPAFDPYKIKTQASITANERNKAARILNTRGKVG